MGEDQSCEYLGIETTPYASMIMLGYERSVVVIIIISSLYLYLSAVSQILLLLE